MSDIASAERDPDDLKFSDLVKFAWSNRWLILLFAILGGLLAAAAAWHVKRRYEGAVLLSPATSQSSSSGLGGLASVVSQFSGVASMAGLNLSGASGNKAEAIATLQSQAILERYIQDRQLLPVLFSGKWDQNKQRWISDDPKQIPTLWEGMTVFQKSVLNVTENAKTGLVLLTITWDDPKIAANWANDLVKITNDYLRDKAIKESQRNIDYLTEQATKTAAVEVRTAIYTVMESEIKKQMMARGNEEFALKVIDPAIAPERASFPRRGYWVLAGLIVGLMLGTIVAGVISVVRQNPARR